MNMNQLAPVTEQEESNIRNEITVWIIAQGQHKHNGDLHIPDDDTPLCSRIHNHTRSNAYNNNAPTQWTKKDVAVFPPGYKDICQYCTKLWRDKND